MDKAAIKLHKMNIFPKVPPLYTHLPSTFLPVFSGTMLPNGLPVSCLPPPDSIPPIVGATTRRPHAYLIFIYVIKRSAVSYVCLLLAAFPVCRGAHRSPARLGCHLHMPRPKKRAVNDRPNKSPEQKRRHAHEGHTAFLELLMGFGSRLRARSSAALTGLAAARSRSGSDSPPDCHSLPSRRFATTGLSFTPPATACLPFHHRKRVSPGNATTNKRHPRTKRNVRGAPNPISKKLSHPQGMREFSGAANGIRTHDLVITNDVLYRLSYSSVSNA